jgi:CheY-like chemotaxis protein
VNILIVDDDEGICATMEDILEERHHLVKTASNGYDAINLAKNHLFDLVLMDMRMPGISGLETYRIMKKDNLSLNIVFMTAYANEDLIKQSKKDGFEILSKPINIDTFLYELN